VSTGVRNHGSRLSLNIDPKRYIAGLDCARNSRLQNRTKPVNTNSPTAPKDGDQCLVIAGTLKGKSGTVRDVNTSKTGHVTITVVQADGARFKTLANNVVVQANSRA
jgi:transcription antitermination factor NusG